MEHHDPSWETEFNHIQDAVQMYAEVEMKAIARRIVHRFKRRRADGIYGNDYCFRTTWDEYCHEVQEGPTEWADPWEATLRPFIDEAIGKVARHAAVILTIHAAAELREGSPDMIGSFWLDGLRQLAQRSIDEAAAKRSMDRFAPLQQD